MKLKNNWRWWQIALFGLFLSWFLGVNLWLAWQESQTIDEAAHITAGYSYLTTRDFRFNPEHPPLLKELSAAPLFTLDVKNIRSLSAWQSGDEWSAGKEFVYGSKSSPRAIMFTARMMPILIALLLGLLTFAVAAFLTNRSYGLLALGLFCFDPNIIAHSHLVTTDVASALGFLLVLAALFYYIEKPSFKKLLLTGLAGGLALSFKFSTLLILLFIPVLIGLSVFIYELPTRSWIVKLWGIIKKSLLIFIVAGLFVFAVYGFEVIKPSSAAAYSGNIARSNALYVHLKDFHIPLYSYLRGVGRVISHSKTSEDIQTTYLLGNYSHTSWNYFLIVFFIKTTITIIAATFFMVIFGLYKLFMSIKSGRSFSKKQLYALSLGAFVIIYLSASVWMKINIGWRHILPIYPVLFILIAIAVSQAAVKFHNQIKAYAVIMLVLIGTTVLSLGLHFPYLISYSNELWPIVNHKTNWPRLTDSNLDWGQDVYRLISYAKAHHDKNYQYSLFSNALLERLDAPSNLKPISSFDALKCRQTGQGNLVVSYQIVYNNDNDTTYNCLRGLKPSYIVGSSILIFNQ